MITGLNHITLSVADLERSFHFYSNVLQCQPVAKWKRGAYLLAGELWLCLTLDANTRKASSPEYTHFALSIAASDFQVFSKRLLQLGVKSWQQNYSEGDSLYILDPDGHKLELHVGNLQSRLTAIRKFPYEEMEFFESSPK